MANPQLPSVIAPIKQETRIFREIVVEPSWEVGTMISNGHHVGIISLYHPIHGNLTFQLSAQQFGALATAVGRANYSIGG